MGARPLITRPIQVGPGSPAGLVTLFTVIVEVPAEAALWLRALTDRTLLCAGRT